MKCTAALFVPYFILKRQCKMVGTSTVFAGIFTLSPIVMYGPSGFARQMEIWIGNVVEGSTSGDPSVGIIGEESLSNLSLRPALTRYPMSLPAGHVGRVDHPLYIDVLDLSLGQASWTIRVVMLLGLVGVTFLMRSPVKDRADPVILWQCAAISLMILLYYPITWGQYCVGVIPACFLIVVTLLWNPTFLNDGLSDVIDTYHFETFAILGLLIVTLRGASQVRTHRHDQTPKVTQHQVDRLPIKDAVHASA